MTETVSDTETGDAVAAADTLPAPTSQAQVVAGPAAAPVKRRRRWLRPLLLIAGPLAVIVGGTVWYYSGGRYISTENAYIHADKVAVSAQVAGPIQTVAVKENQAVAKGDVLFQIDRGTYEIAVEQAEANLQSVRQDVQALKETYQQEKASAELAQTNLEYAQRRYDRQAKLLKNNVVSQATLDDVQNALDKAEQQIKLDRFLMRTTLARIGGSADVPVEKTAQYQQAKAQLDQAQLDLAHTTVKAPFNGVAGNTPEPGQYVTPGSAVLSLVSSDGIWIDGNFKETQLTYVKPGQAVDIEVDAYPDQVWQGTVASVSPATGSEFSVLPAQNATGNWVKVVQRIPVRIAVDTEADGPVLRAGMSTQVEIDTHHQRELPAFARTALGWIDGIAGKPVAEARPAAVAAEVER